MEDRVLIIQKHGPTTKLKAKVRKRIKNGYVPNDYEKVCNLQDPNDLSYLLEDLYYVLNAPIDKAYIKFKERNGHSGLPW
jgi:hypothetical protein